MTNLVTTHVAAGEFIVDTKQAIQLEALLSSCVGVVLYDPENNIGGLSHFLLPEPISISNSTDFKKYASTGLQVFFNELIAQGAVTENLRAVIAGGAFSGNVSQQDINLDIGGRTADIVKKILAKKNITIEASETGGFFSCKLSLNMQTWETKIVPVTISNDESKAPETFSLDEIDETFKTIQPIPQVALKILRMISDNTCDFGDLSKEVKKDQVISAQVLKFCNSAVFGGRGSIDTIGDALLIIGQNSLAKIISNIAVKNLIANAERGYSLVQGGLYHHSIGVALLSEKIAEKTGIVTPFAAYTAGLLHDIGKVALDQFIASALPFFYRDNEEHLTTDIVGLENKYLGINHTAAGKKLSEIWGIPESISSVIEHHHTPRATENLPTMVYIIALSNTILHMFKAKPEIVGVDMSNINFLMDRLEIPVTEFSSLIDLIPIEILSSSPESVIF